MANPPVNSNQFYNHQEHLSGLENDHEFNLTDKGIQLLGDAKGFIPIANVEADGWNGSEYRDPSKAHPPSSLNFDVLSEDPNVRSEIYLYNRNSGKDGFPASGIETVEHHSYGPDPEPGQRNTPNDSQSHFMRYNSHDSISDAVKYIQNGSEERAGYLAAETMPGADAGVTRPASPDQWNSSVSGKWLSTPRRLRPKSMVPPSTIKYDRWGNKDEIHHRYQVDTSTREPVRGEDR